MGPWGLMEFSKFETPVPAHAVTFAPAGIGNTPKSSAALSSVSKSHTSSTQSSSSRAHGEAVVYNSKHSSEGLSSSFISLAPEDAALVFELGSFVADVTSNVRLPSGLVVNSKTSERTEPACEEGNSVELLFERLAIKKRTGRRGKFTPPLTATTSALSPLESQLISARESISAQLLLPNNNRRHIGRLGPSVTMSLGPLLVGDFIRVCSERKIQSKLQHHA